MSVKEAIEYAAETGRRLSGAGWKRPLHAPSLPEVFRTIAVPRDATWWRRLLAFVGPGYLVAVGYMDPGNWATDIAGGAAFRYTLLSVVLLSSLTAMFLQSLSAKLGIVTGRDLAQACRDSYSPRASLLLWLSAEVAIVACDIAEVIGAAIALKLLFHIPMVLGVIITAADVLLVLALQHKGFRWIEALVIGLIGLMMVIFWLEVAYSHPQWRALMGGFVPSASIVTNGDMLYLSLAILGATVMPHNLYLHSSIIQTRSFGHSEPEIRDSIRLANIDSSLALTLAFFVNAAILVVAAATFYSSGHQDLKSIEDAYKLLSPLVGVAVATPLFAIALLASGQNSTLTGTLAGQVILEGFTNFRLKPWARRMISRLLAIVPAVIAIAYFGEHGVDQLMLFSQVVLSAQLSFAVVPLIQFTSDKEKMGVFANGLLTRWTGWTLAAVIAGLNVYLIYAQLALHKG